VTLWRSRDLAVVAELRGPCGGISSLAYSHDGRLLAATGNGRATVVWNLTTGKIVRRLGPTGARGNAGVAISFDDRLVATAGVDSVLRIYNLQTGRRIAAVQGDGTLQDLDFSSDGKLLAAAGLGEHILIWNVKERALERTIKQNALILTLRFSPDGQTIATGDLSGDVNFWDAASGRKIGRTLGNQNGYVISVSYNPTGTELVTTSTDGKFRLWDLASGKLIGAPLPGGDTGGWGGFFPNGKKVIAVYPSGIGLIWNADPAAWNAHACRVANRNLTPTEWHDFLPQRNYHSVCP
jgi:WD40 repeat protein